jgi:signal transduction histidine kinase
MPADPTLPPEPRVRLGRRYALALVATGICWAALVGAVVYLVFSRTSWVQQADAAHVREWLDESRVFRKTLPDLVADYVVLRDKYPGNGPDAGEVINKAEEIREQLRVMAMPPQIYQGYLPLFPDIYRLEVRFPGRDWQPLAWESPTPRPRQQNQTKVDVVEYALAQTGNRAVVRCEYRLHAFNQRQREAADRQQQQLLAIGLGFLAVLPVVVLGYWSLQRERSRELQRVQAQRLAEHAGAVALQEKVARQDAERSTLEIKSQLYASIGIMAGSYAHNIKNLLVRPNDLLARCADADGIPPPQRTMLGEVRHTLGTVTERLQQILRTVRRDPSRAEVSRLDLNDLLKETARTWEDLAREKWKLTLTCTLAGASGSDNPDAFEPEAQARVPQPLWINGDVSHLQQAIENLLFNARDATFEMRNYLRDEARRNEKMSADDRRKALIDAAGWRGKIELRAWRASSRKADVPDSAILEVTDNGIGMTPEVKERCIETHFTTKRDNALYEGYNAGMGLGLSFTVVVLEHHGAMLDIETAPLKGTTFRVQFPLAG